MNTYFFIYIHFQGSATTVAGPYSTLYEAVSLTTDHKDALIQGVDDTCTRMSIIEMYWHDEGMWQELNTHMTEVLDAS